MSAGLALTGVGLLLMAGSASTLTGPRCWPAS